VWQEGGENLVEVSVEGRNQRDEQTAIGMAVAALPAHG
jgi:hypothetical protein